MLTSLQHFFYMGGYGGYVFSAYGCVLAILLLQWFIPWRHWRRYLQQQKISHE